MKTASRWLVAGVLLECASANADTLLHRQSPGRTFGIPSDTEYLDDFGHTSGSLIADAFSLNQTANICRANVYGFFGGTSPGLDPLPPLNETLRVRIWSDTAGLPGTVLHEGILQNPSRTWTGFFVALGPIRKEYLYRLEIPGCFAAQAGASYWLEVDQIDDVGSLFRWENANIFGGFAQRFPIDTPWRSSSPNQGQMAYELWTPEPCSGVLLALAVGILRRVAAVRR